MFTVTEKVAFIEKCLGKGDLSRNGQNIDVSCPFCPTKKAGKKKLVIRTSDDANHCWVCGWKSRTLLPIIKKMGHQRSIIDEYVSKFAPHLKNRAHDETHVVKILPLPADFKPLVSFNGVDPDFLAVCNYAARRNLSVEDLWLYKVGASNEFPWKRRILFPSFDASGTLNYIVGRAVDFNTRPRYEVPHGIDRNDIIFNECYIDWTKPVKICEGVFDAIACGENAIPLLGSTLNENTLLFNKIAANETPVVLVLDGDMWLTKTFRLATALEAYGLDVKLADTRQFEDPAAAGKQAMQECIEAAQPRSWESKFGTRLERAMSSSKSMY